MVRQFVFIVLLLIILTVSLYMVYDSLVVHPRSGKSCSKEGLTTINLKEWDVDAMMEIHKTKQFDIPKSDIPEFIQHLIDDRNMPYRKNEVKNTDYTHMGCYIDDIRNRQLSNWATTMLLNEGETNASKVQQCANIAHGNYRYFGMQYAGECWVGNSDPTRLGKLGADRCNRTANGWVGNDPNKNGGGDGETQNIYQFKQSLYQFDDYSKIISNIQKKYDNYSEYREKVMYNKQVSEGFGVRDHRLPIERKAEA